MDLVHAKAYKSKNTKTLSVSGLKKRDSDSV